MPRICFVFQAFGSHSNYAVQDSGIVVARAADTEPASELELKVCCEILLQPVHVRIGPQRREVVTVYNSCQVTFNVMKDAR